MSKSIRRPQRLFAAAMWALSLLFAVMLIGLGGLVIADLPRVETEITTEQFVNAGTLSELDAGLSGTESALQVVTRDMENAVIALQSASADYQAARAALDAWLAARSVTEEDVQNPEVLARTRAVEALRIEERAALGVLEAVRARSVEITREQEDLMERRYALLEEVRPAVEAARRARDLKVFLYRLALTLPLLAVAAWFIARKRRSPYWPLYRGFVLFALFAFFVELVPYLPSYGGYVRYVVGVVLILIAGHYLIRGMKSYLARKQVEESRNEGDRRAAIGYETAIKKIGAGTCPGCDRAIERRDGVVADFCVHCGIRLQCECSACGTPNVSFHRFCLHCGTSMHDAEPGRSDAGVPDLGRLPGPV